MAIVELDPLFVRALRLLHSKSKDSDIQLKALMDECIRQRKAGLPINIPTPQPAPIVQGVPAKRQRLEISVGATGPPPGGSKMVSSPMTPSPASLAVEETEDMDIDFQSLNDCTCCICKSFNQENGNKLMECHTCQNLYHQECHNPPITDEEVSDPRLVWNCSNCSVNIQPTMPTKSSTSQSLSKSSSKPSGSKSLSSSSSSGSRGPSRSALPNSSNSSGSSHSGVDKRLQMMKKKSSSTSGSSSTSAGSSQRKSK